MKKELEMLYEMAQRCISYESEEEFLQDAHEDEIQVEAKDFELLRSMADEYDEEKGLLKIYGVSVVCDEYEDWDAEAV